jgi:hypothetical protein
LRKATNPQSAELRTHAEAGVELQLLMNGEFFLGQRYPSRGLALISVISGSHTTKRRTRLAGRYMIATARGSCSLKISFDASGPVHMRANHRSTFTQR